MTQEEKAKRYDEVTKEIEDFFEGKQKMPNNVDKTLELLFPELKENEDEKIRKALICGMYTIKEQHKTYFASIPIDNVIAWLEKQGDKDELIKELGEYKAKYTQEVLEKHLRTMNKDDERLRKTTIDFLKDFADKGYENAVECIDWLEKQSEQKSQGKLALEAINEEKADNANKIEQKPAWSEEDEKCIRLSTDIIDSALRAGFCVQLDRDRCVDWLKSLRPQNWKPSDEQMDALEYHLKHTNENSRLYKETKKLYDQLKKLK